MLAEDASRFSTAVAAPRKILYDEPLRRRLGRRAAELAETQTPQVAAERLVEALDTCLASRGGSKKGSKVLSAST